jgi:hypothetical protein
MNIQSAKEENGRRERKERKTNNNKDADCV